MDQSLYPEDLDQNTAEMLQANNGERQINKYFKEGHWGQCFELLQHLCQYSDNAVLVCGEEGFGKTTLCQASLDEQLAGLEYFYLDGSSIKDNFSLLAQLAMGFNLNWQPASGVENNEQSFISAVSAESSVADKVLLVDDAHLLAEGELHLLLMLANAFKASVASTQGSSRRFHLILLGVPELEQKVLSSKVNKQVLADLHVIDLEPLSLVEVAAYLQHKWVLAGNNTPLLLNKKILKKLTQLAEGNPQKLEAIAKGILEQSSKKFNFKALLGALVFAGLLGGVLKFSINNQEQDIKRSLKDWFKSGVTFAKEYVDEDNNPVERQQVVKVESKVKEDQEVKFETQEQSNNEIVEKTVVTETQQKDLVVISEHPIEAEVQQKKDVDTEESVNVETQSGSTSDTAEQQVNAGEDKVAAGIADEVAKPGSSLSPQQQDQTVIQSNQALAQPTQETPQSVQAKPDRCSLRKQSKVQPKTKGGKKLTKHEQAILAFPAQNYTVQLLGASKISGIEEFIKKNKLGNKAHYYRTSYEGKPWNILVYNNYASYEAAKSAVATLPARAKKLRPWIRKVSSIHKVINKQK